MIFQREEKVEVLTIKDSGSREELLQECYKTRLAVNQLAKAFLSFLLALS
jgi:hypothetical protein